MKRLALLPTATDVIDLTKCMFQLVFFKSSIKSGAKLQIDFHDNNLFVEYLFQNQK